MASGDDYVQDVIHGSIGVEEGLWMELGGCVDPVEGCNEPIIRAAMDGICGDGEVRGWDNARGAAQARVLPLGYVSLGRRGDFVVCCMGRGITRRFYV